MDKKQLLIVDDDEDHIILIKRALRDYLNQFETSFASNGLEALNAVQQKLNQKSNFDLILLDINTPVMDGYDFLQKVRRERSIKFTPIIVLTTTESPELLKKAYRAGANTVIQKETFFNPTHDVASILVQYWLKLAIFPKS